MITKEEMAEIIATEAKRSVAKMYQECLAVFDGVYEPKVAKQLTSLLLRTVADVIEREYGKLGAPKREAGN